MDPLHVHYHWHIGLDSSVSSPTFVKSTSRTKPKRTSRKQQEEIKEKHCVRCHSSFFDAINGPKCEVPHIWDDAPSERYYDEVVFYSACCGETATLRMSLDGKILNDPEPCYRGTHDVNPKDVKYNNLSINPCKDGFVGSCESKIQDYAKDPVFYVELYGESHQSRLARRLVPELYSESDADPDSSMTSQRSIITTA